MSQGPAHDDIRDAGKAQGTPMSWADTVKATALAALAGRTATAGHDLRRHAVELESARRLADARQPASQTRHPAISQ